MFRRLGDVLRGQRSLGETYWLYFVVPHIPILIGIFALSMNAMRVMGQGGPRLYYGVMYGLLSLSLLVTLLSGFAVIQSAFNRAQSTFWAAIAILIVSGNIIFGGVRTPALILGTYRMSEYERQQGMALLNAQLPRKVDSITTLLHVEIKGETATYKMGIEPAYANRIASTAMRVVIRPKVCELLRTTFKQMGVTKVVYEYSAESAKLFTIEITSADCS